MAYDAEKRDVHKENNIKDPKNKRHTREEIRLEGPAPGDEIDRLP